MQFAAEATVICSCPHPRRQPLSVDAADRVLLNPATGKALTRPRLYHRMLALGKRAGVVDAHPHRFSDTLAVDMLTRGASPYDVAKVLGDTIETIDPFVKEVPFSKAVLASKNWPKKRQNALKSNHKGLTSDSAQKPVQFCGVFSNLLSNLCHNFQRKLKNAEKTKPFKAAGPVSRILSAVASRTTIPLGHALLRGSSDLPGGLAHRASTRPAKPGSLPIWSCSVWGFPCPFHYWNGGALLPHLFTLTQTSQSGDHGRYIFCGTSVS